MFLSFSPSGGSPDVIFVQTYFAAQVGSQAILVVCGIAFRNEKREFALHLPVVHFRPWKCAFRMKNSHAKVIPVSINV